MTPRLSYFDFPFSRWAFQHSRGATSSAVSHRGVHFRKYGRNVLEYTLVSWEPGAPVGEVLLELRRDGAKLKSVNFLEPPGENEGELYVPTKPGPREFFIPGDFDLSFANRSAKTRQTIRRACRDVIALPYSALYGGKVGGGLEAIRTIFDGWLEWAAGRHFMVFKGHYRKWLDLYTTTPSPQSFLFVLTRESRPIGLFGGELDAVTKEAQITIAKHLPELDGKALWTVGLREVLERWRPTLVHCGSTADVLKTHLGFEALPSFVVDWKTFKEEL